MITLAIIFGTVGAMLVLVGLVGGGFTFSGSIMPRVGGFARILSFGIGGLLLVLSLGLAVSDQGVLPAPPSPTPVANDNDPVVDPQPQAPSIGYIAVPDGSTAFVFELPDTSSRIVAEISNGVTVEIVCTAVGESVTSPLNALTSSLWNRTTDGGFVPDVLVDTGTLQPTRPNCLD